MNKPAIPTATKDDINKIMEYVPGRGLVWKVARGRSTIGQIVGGMNENPTIRLGESRVYAHHIIWFLHFGYWPSEQRISLSFKDGNLLNRTIENLEIYSR